jgi:hypothetical protein
MAPPWRAAGTPDLDGDGRPDLIWHNQKTGQLIFWLMDGVTRRQGGIGSFSPGVVAPAWRVVGTPDLDGDGSTDLLWHDQVSGQLVYWRMAINSLLPDGMGHMSPAVMDPVWELAPGS